MKPYTTENAKEIKSQLDRLADTDPEAYHGLMDEVLYSLAEEGFPELFAIIRSAKKPRWWACA